MLRRSRRTPWRFTGGMPRLPRRRGLRLDRVQRLQKDAMDNCLTCHMPHSETKVRHVAFTHHRIGLHSPQPPAKMQRIPDLEPTDDVSRLGLRDLERNLDLAYLEVAGKGEYAQYADVFTSRTGSCWKACIPRDFGTEQPPKVWGVLPENGPRCAARRICGRQSMQKMPGLKCVPMPCFNWPFVRPRITTSRPPSIC